jgi:hypothetical protein
VNSSKKAISVLLWGKAFCLDKHRGFLVRRESSALLARSFLAYGILGDVDVLVFAEALQVFSYQEFADPLVVVCVGRYEE